MADTMHLGKDELIARAKAEMQRPYASTSGCWRNARRA